MNKTQSLPWRFLTFGWVWQGWILPQRRCLWGTKSGPWPSWTEGNLLVGITLLPSTGAFRPSQPGRWLLILGHLNRQQLTAREGPLSPIIHKHTVKNWQIYLGRPPNRTYVDVPEQIILDKWSKNQIFRGSWVAQLVKWPTLYFCSGRDLMDCGLSPALDSVLSVESTWVSLLLSLYSFSSNPPTHFLSQRNK